MFGYHPTERSVIECGCSHSNQSYRLAKRNLDITFVLNHDRPAVFSQTEMDKNCGTFDLDVDLDQLLRPGTARPSKPEVNKADILYIDWR